MTWTKEEITKVTEADDLHVSPFREDGETLGTPTWIWSVVVDDNLYARAYNGTKSRWYQAAVTQDGGQVTIAGLTKDVDFEKVAGPIQNKIDDAYRAKYGDSEYLPPMVERHAKEATVRIVPNR